MVTDISIMIAGKAGDGVLFTGNVLAKIMKRQGWEVATYRDFPSNIRGEDTSYTIRATLKKIYGRGDKVDVLIAFDCDAVLKHLKYLDDGAVVLCEGTDVKNILLCERRGKIFHEFPARKLARTHFKNEIFKNMIALGGLSFILDLNFRTIGRVILEAFLERKGKEIVQKNIQAINLGCEQAKKMIKPRDRHKIVKRKDRDRILISGDEAIAFGALAAGCRFFAAYPICPASEIWQWLVLYFPKFNGVVVQTEDELAAINMAIGASYAGARAMTSTSGPGASLMMEGYGLAGMTEVPLVVVHVQRTGPSTGIPTKSEQGDLNQWVHGSHGDFPRIVISPGTVEECYEFTVKAFNLADKYQVPVILLTEQNYGQNYFTVKKFDLSSIKIDRGKLLSQADLLRIEDYKRYQFTPDGVSPRAIPSLKKGIHMVESTEHDEKGYRDEEPENRIRMMQKRMKKLTNASKDLIPPRVWGDRTSDIGIIGFGSTYGPIQEARMQLKEKGIQSQYLQIRTLWPFPSRIVQSFTGRCRRVFVVENNFSGQLSSLTRSQVSTPVEFQNVLNYSSQTFCPEEISQHIQKAL